MIMITLMIMIMIMMIIMIITMIRIYIIITTTSTPYRWVSALAMELCLSCTNPSICELNLIMFDITIYHTYHDTHHPWTVFIDSYFRHIILFCPYSPAKFPHSASLRIFAWYLSEILWNFHGVNTVNLKIYQPLQSPCSWAILHIC